MARTDLSDTMRAALRAFARGDGAAGSDRTRDALRRRNLIGGDGGCVYLTPAGLEALGFTPETVRARDLRVGDKLYSQGPMGLIRGGLWTMVDVTPGYPAAGVVQVMFSNRVVLTYSADLEVEVVERGPEPVRASEPGAAPEPSDEPLPRPPSAMEARHHGRREAWLAAHGGGDRIPCAGCSGEGVVPYGDPQYPSRTVWRCVKCAEREAAIAARATADESAEQAEDVRFAAAVVLADLLDRADALEGSTDRTSVRSLRMMATAMSVLEVEYDLDEAAEPVVSLRARAQDGQAAPPATSDTPRELREPYTAADAPRACDVCGSPVPDGETCGECGRTFPRGADVVGLPYAPLVEDGNDGHDLERRVCPVCLDVTLDYAAHWRDAGHVELTEADGPFLTESREQSTAAAFRLARGEQPPAGEWIA